MAEPLIYDQLDTFAEGVRGGVARAEIKGVGILLGALPRESTHREDIALREVYMRLHQPLGVVAPGVITWDPRGE